MTGSLRVAMINFWAINRLRMNGPDAPAYTFVDIFGIRRRRRDALSYKTLDGDRFVWITSETHQISAF